MKKIAIIAFIPVLLMVILSMMPTGATSDEVIDGYMSTTSFSSSSSSYLLYMMQFSLAAEGGFDEKYAGSTGEKIAQLAVDLCEKLGNGGNESYSDTSGRKTGQFRYSQSSTSDYSSAEALRQSINEMLADSSQTRSISCCAFATFCWHTMLTGSSPFGTQCTRTVETNFQDIIEGDGTAEYIIEHAKPGDLLFYTKDGSTSPPKASNGNYRHAEVYIGPYSGTDAHGNSYTLEHACAGSNEPGVNRDACIKSLESSVSTGRRVYLVSLEKWVASGHAPVDNSDQVESLDDIL